MYQQQHRQKSPPPSPMCRQRCPSLYVQIAREGRGEERNTWEAYTNGGREGGRKRPSLLANKRLTGRGRGGREHLSLNSICHSKEKKKRASLNNVVKLDRWRRRSLHEILLASLACLPPSPPLSPLFRKCTHTCEMGKKEEEEDDERRAILKKESAKGTGRKKKKKKRKKDEEEEKEEKHLSEKQTGSGEMDGGGGGRCRGDEDDADGGCEKVNKTLLINVSFLVLVRTVGQSIDKEILLKSCLPACQIL